MIAALKAAVSWFKRNAPIPAYISSGTLKTRVGGALKSGYRQAIEDGMEIVVKIDGDGQMDPQLIPLFTRPIMAGEADYSKGNRFYDLEKIRSMPAIRIFEMPCFPWWQNFQPLLEYF